MARNGKIAGLSKIVARQVIDLFLVGARGFEPPAARLVAERSNLKTSREETGKPSDLVTTWSRGGHNGLSEM